jgi:hypothetical protein
VEIRGVNGDFGKYPVTVKFMRGVFKLRKPSPRYKTTWDVNLVLNQLRQLDNGSISLKQLSLKTVMLLALSTCQRTQTLAALKLSNAKFHQTKVVFTFDIPLKTSRPGYETIVEIYTFHQDVRVCPLSCIKEYMARTKIMRGQVDQLFVSFQKPHAKVWSQTLGRWLMISLKTAGVDRLYSAHSVRGASTSKAASRIDSNIILSVAGWTKAQTFAKFYKKPIKSASAFSGLMK